MEIADVYKSDMCIDVGYKGKRTMCPHYERDEHAPVIASDLRIDCKNYVLCSRSLRIGMRYMEEKNDYLC